MFGASANDRRGCLALTLTTNLMLRAILLSAVLATALCVCACGCVRTEKLEQDIATLKAHQDASDKLVSAVLKRLASALAQVEAAQNEIARALAVGGDH